MLKAEKEAKDLYQADKNLAESRGAQVALSPMKLYGQTPNHAGIPLSPVSILLTGALRPSLLLAPEQSYQQAPGSGLPLQHRLEGYELT